MYHNIVSLWEIIIETSLVKLGLDIPLDQIITSFILPGGIEILAIQSQHLLVLQTMPFHHRDQMLIFQAKS